MTRSKKQASSHATSIIFSLPPPASPRRASTRASRIACASAPTSSAHRCSVSAARAARRAWRARTTTCVARRANYALLLSVELLRSLTLQRDDLSIANIIASRACSVMAPRQVVLSADDAKPGARIVDTSSVFYPDTERIFGWDVVDTGFKIVLSSKVPNLITREPWQRCSHFSCATRSLHQRHSALAAASGGPKVLDAFCRSALTPRRRFGSLTQVAARNRQSLVGSRALYSRRPSRPRERRTRATTQFWRQWAPGFRASCFC